MKNNVETEEDVTELGFSLYNSVTLKSQDILRFSKKPIQVLNELFKIFDGTPPMLEGIL